MRKVPSPRRAPFRKRSEGWREPLPKYGRLSVSGNLLRRSGFFGERRPTLTPWWREAIRSKNFHMEEALQVSVLGFNPDLCTLPGRTVETWKTLLDASSLDLPRIRRILTPLK